MKTKGMQNLVSGHHVVIPDRAAPGVPLIDGCCRIERPEHCLSRWISHTSWCDQPMGRRRGSACPIPRGPGAGCERGRPDVRRPCRRRPHLRAPLTPRPRGAHSTPSSMTPSPGSSEARMPAGQWILDDPSFDVWRHPRVARECGRNQARHVAWRKPAPAATGPPYRATPASGAPT